ncbi:hypothetical protein BX666DRAFT_2026069 [Dichotomocladium elegans]|nr:hypothetical protein BX666DRAFT_2026069 [Dichotomocladium elegans]
MSLENPTCFLRDDLQSSQRSSTDTTHCRRRTFLHSHPRIYPDHSSTIAVPTAPLVPSISTPTLLHSTFFVLLLSRLLDVVIFTSAIAITAYNYWAGDIQPSHHQYQQLLPDPLSRSSNRSSSSSSSSTDSTVTATSFASDQGDDDIITKRPDPLLHTCRRRTEIWAAESVRHYRRRSTYDRPTFASINKFVSSSFPIIDHNNNPTSSLKHRRRSPIHGSNESQGEMLARMQSKVENLIQEGQAALTSSVGMINQEEAIRDYPDFEDTLCVASSINSSHRCYHYHHNRRSGNRRHSDYGN